jgi:hypothetical protein
MENRGPDEKYTVRGVILRCTIGLLIGIGFILPVILSPLRFKPSEIATALVSFLIFTFGWFSGLPAFIKRDIGPDALSRRMLKGYIAVMCTGAILIILVGILFHCLDTSLIALSAYAILCIIANFVLPRFYKGSSSGKRLSRAPSENA